MKASEELQLVIDYIDNKIAEIEKGRIRLDAKEETLHSVKTVLSNRQQVALREEEKLKGVLA